MTRTVATHCRICEALCGVIVTVDGDTVVSVRGDPDDPVSNGYTCPKGRGLGALHHHPRRLDGPMLRRDGELVAVSWDELLGDLDAKLREIVDAHGPDAVGIYGGTGTAFDANGRRIAEKWHRLIGSRSRYTSGSIDAPAKPMVAEMMSGFAGVTPAVDRENPGLVLLIGVNPVVSHGHLNAFPDPVVAIRDLAERSEVWVMDPRRSESARLATRHLAPLPGTDWAVLAFLVRSLLREGADHDYLDEHASGVEVLREAVEPYDMERAAMIAGLDASDLEDLVAAIRRHGTVAIQTGTGVTMSAAANLVEWLAWAVQIVTHSFDVPGGSWFNPGFLRAMESRKRAPGDGVPEPGPPSRPELPRRLGEYPVAAMLDEIETGNLRALFVLGGSPIRAFPEVDRTRKAMEQLDVLVLADVTHTDLAPTHVFACADQLERADLPHYVDQFLPIVMTKFAPPVFAPKHDRRTLWWPFAMLGERWGLDVLGDGLDPATAGDEDLLRVLGDRSRSDFETIRSQRVVVNEPPQIFGWVHEQVLPDGRWRLAPKPLLDQLAAMNGSSAGLRLIPHRQVRHLNSVFLPTDKADTAGVAMHPDDAAELGVSEGDTIVVRSESGSIEGVARVSDRIRPGAVTVPHGFEEPNVCALTSATTDVDPLSGMVLQSGILVTIEGRDTSG